MGKGRVGKRYPKQPIPQVKASALNRVKAIPTLDDSESSMGTDEGRFSQGNISEATNPLVPASERQWQKFNNFIAENLAWVAITPVVLGALAFVIYLNYDLTHLKKDHYVLETKVSKTEEKIINIEKSQAKQEKDILYANKGIEALEKSIAKNSIELREVFVEQIKTTTKLNDYTKK